MVKVGKDHTQGEQISFFPQKKKILSNASLDHNLNTNCAPFSIKYAQTGTTLHSFIPYVFTADVFTGLENTSWEFPEPCEVLGAALASLGAVPCNQLCLLPALLLPL